MNFVKESAWEGQVEGEDHFSIEIEGRSQEGTAS